MIDEPTIFRAALALHEAAPGAKVVLFGSYARGEASEASDLDFLVIEPVVSARRAETVRLQKALADLPVPVDILVASQGTFDAWRDVPGTVYHDAAREGRVL